MATPDLAKQLRTARDKRQLSLRDLSAASAGARHPEGIAVSYLHRLERGEVDEPSPHVLRALAGALGLTYASLMRSAAYYP